MPFMKVGNAERPDIVNINHGTGDELVNEIWEHNSLVDPGFGNNTLIWKSQEEFDVPSPAGACDNTLNIQNYIEQNRQYPSTQRFKLNITESRGKIVTGDLTGYDEVVLHILPGVIVGGKATSGNGGTALVLESGSVIKLDNEGSIYGAGGAGGSGGGAGSISQSGLYWIHRSRWSSAAYGAAAGGAVPACVPHSHYYERYLTGTKWAWQNTGCTSQKYGSMTASNWGQQGLTYVGHTKGRVKVGFQSGSRTSQHLLASGTRYVSRYGGTGGAGEGCQGPAQNGSSAAQYSVSGYTGTLFDGNGNNIPYPVNIAGSGGKGGDWGQQGLPGSTGNPGYQPGKSVDAANGSLLPSSVIGDVKPSI